MSQDQCYKKALPEPEAPHRYRCPFRVAWDLIYSGVCGPRGCISDFQAGGGSRNSMLQVFQPQAGKRNKERNHLASISYCMPVRELEDESPPPNVLYCQDLETAGQLVGNPKAYKADQRWTERDPFFFELVYIYIFLYTSSWVCLHMGPPSTSCSFWSPFNTPMLARECPGHHLWL